MEDPKFRKAVERDSAQVKAVVEGKNRFQYQKDLAAALNVAAPTVSNWKARGLVVQDEEGFYLKEETRRKVEAAYGFKINSPLSVRRKNSYWSKGSHCISLKARRLYDHMQENPK